MVKFYTSRVTFWATVILICGFGASRSALAQYSPLPVTENFASRKAVIIESSNLIELNGFSFSNVFADTSLQLQTNLSWKNTSGRTIIAFEVVFLNFDPFNRRMANDSVWLISGHNSVDWSPLRSTEESSDSLLEYGAREVFTAVAYIRAVRFDDGTVWTADSHDILTKIVAALPQLREIESVEPRAPLQLESKERK